MDLKPIADNIIKSLPDDRHFTNKVSYFIYKYAVAEYYDSVKTLNLMEIPNFNRIGNLTNLEVLNLSYNQIRTLPESIGNLTNLEELNLSGNQIRTLPESIGNLTNLEVLNLSDNQIEFLPSSIGELESLGQLRLSDNPLRILRESMKKLKKLRLLTLRNTKLDSLPTFFDPQKIKIYR